MTGDERRFGRQEQLFGAGGQEEISATRVAVVGVGGLGSHIVQQLAYLGVRDFLLVDPDRVEETNLNRLIGARPDDARTGRLKVGVAKDLIRSIAPEAEVQTLDDVFVSDAGFDLLMTGDVTFGSVDNEVSRLVLNEFCQVNDIPFIDTASDVDPRGPGPGYGGRVVVSDGGGGCVVCLDLLDQEALDVEQATENERRQREEIYGIDAEALGGAGPSVVSVNGLVASLAVTEFMNLVTGLRQPQLYLRYDGSLGGVFVGSERQVDTCFYCDSQRGRGSEVDVRRHLRRGLGEVLRR